MKHESRKAVVFGASSRGGSGWTIAETLARDGWEVLVCARRLEGVEILAKQIKGIAQRCDVSCEEDVAAVAEMVKTRFGSVNTVINAAGQAFASSILGSSAEDLYSAASINYFGPFFIIKHMAPLIVKGGAITIITSLAGVRVVDGQVIYGCAKAAATMLVEYAALELGPRRVRVNALVPGMILSPMIEDMFTGIPDTHALYMKEIPLERGATVEEVAEAAIWLTSPACFANGIALRLDGGNHITRQPLMRDLPADIMHRIK